MRNSILQISFIIGVIFFFGCVIFFLRKRALTIKYSILWLISALFMLLFSVFPDLLTPVANFLGFELLSNAVFSILIAFVIIILLQQTSITSKQNEMIKTLTQANALLEKRIRELEENHK